jgi:hypothetical protein
MYVRRHVTFLNFRNVQNTPSRCARIVNSTQFDIDVATKSVPKFAMYIPNNRNNGHDTDIATADRWLESRFGSLINDPTFMNGTLFIVIFDEGGQTNTIYASLNGAGIQPGATSDTRYTHYNLLRTIEEILHLGTLGRQDATAAPIDGIWRR